MSELSTPGIIARAAVTLIGISGYLILALGLVGWLYQRYRR